MVSYAWLLLRRGFPYWPHCCCLARSGVSWIWVQTIPLQSLWTLHCEDCKSAVRMRPNTHKDRSHFHFNPELLLALWYFGDASLNLEDKIAQRKTEFQMQSKALVFQELHVREFLEKESAFCFSVWEIVKVPPVVSQHVSQKNKRLERVTTNTNFF